MGTSKSHTELSPAITVNVEPHQCEFCRGTVLPIGIDMQGHCNLEGTNHHFTRS